MPDDYKLLGVRLDPDLHREFKILCVQQGLVMAEVVRKLIVWWVAKQKEGESEKEASWTLEQ